MWQCPEMVRGGCYSGSTKQSHFPQCKPARSLPPDGSRTLLLAISLEKCDFRPPLHRLAGAKQGLSFRRGVCCFHKPFFPQRTGSGFNDWARAVLHQTVTLPGSGNLQCQLSLLLLSEGSQKYPAKELTCVPVSLQGMTKV